MIILTNAASVPHKLQLVTDAAVTVDVHASFMDVDGVGPSANVTPGSQNTAITTAATTDIVAAPGANTYRNVKKLNVRNKHASASVAVTLLLDQNGTDFEIIKETLLAGDVLQYIEGVGFFTIRASVITNPVQVARLAADQSNSTTTLTEVTGLTLATGTGTYVFEYFLLWQAAATTTGFRFSVNHDGTVTSFVAAVLWPGGTAAAADAVDQDFVAAGGQLLSGFFARAKSTTGWGTTLSVDTANADVLVQIVGMMVVTVAGNLELWNGSEVAAAQTVKAGSSLRLTKTS